MIKNFFLDHPNENNMTYFAHLKHASYLGMIMFLGSASLFIHGLVPKLFKNTGSNTIKQLYNIIYNDELKLKININSID